MLVLGCVRCSRLSGQRNAVHCVVLVGWAYRVVGEVGYRWVGRSLADYVLHTSDAGSIRGGDVYAGLVA